MDRPHPSVDRQCQRPCRGHHGTLALSGACSQSIVAIVPASVACAMPSKPGRRSSTRRAPARRPGLVATFFWQGRRTLSALLVDDRPCRPFEVAPAPSALALLAAPVARMTVLPCVVGGL